MMQPTPPLAHAGAPPLEGIIGLIEQAFRARETNVLHIDCDMIGAPKCAGARLRLEHLTLPSMIGYRFQLAVVVDDNPAQRKLATTYPLHGASLSEMSIPIPLHLYVKHHFEIFVRRRAIQSSYRFLNEKRDLAKHLLINATRPDVKEPEIVKFVGSATVLFAPPNGWN